MSRPPLLGVILLLAAAAPPLVPAAPSLNPRIILCGFCAAPLGLLAPLPAGSSPRVAAARASGNGGALGLVAERVRSGKPKKGVGKSSSSSSKRWLNEHMNDKYVKDAQKDGYRSRAAYKLLQIQEQDSLLKAGNVVLDLGSAPGSWSQVARKILGPTGVIVATDILDMKPLPGVRFVKGDFLDEFSREEIALALEGKRADVVLSDMAPNLSGQKLIDQGRHYNLVDLALFMCKNWLKAGGSAAFKVFEGEGYSECLTEMRGQFEKVHIRNPKASRDRSPEKFLVGIGYIRQDEAPAQPTAEAAGSSEPEAGAGGGGEGGGKASGRKKKKLDDLMDGMYG